MVAGSGTTRSRPTTAAPLGTTAGDYPAYPEISVVNWLLSVPLQHLLISKLAPNLGDLMLISAVLRICETYVGDVATKNSTARKRSLRMPDTKKDRLKSQLSAF